MSFLRTVFGQYGATNSDVSAIRQDASTEALINIDHAHHKVHSGSHYKAGYQDTSMVASDTIELLFVTPDTTEWAHWKLVAQSTGEVVVAVYEGTTTSANGTAITRWNRNRNSVNTSSTLVYHTPTVTADGTKMVEKWIGSSGFRENSGGESRGDNEFILKQNTKYLVRLTAVSDDIKGAIGGDWYEHTDRN